MEMGSCYSATCYFPYFTILELIIILDETTDKDVSSMFPGDDDEAWWSMINKKNWKWMWLSTMYDKQMKISLAAKGQKGP